MDETKKVLTEEIYEKTRDNFDYSSVKKKNIASEENNNETNIKENEKEDQDFLICVKSEKDYGPIWEVQVPE